jgi:hypothetical protein
VKEVEKGGNIARMREMGNAFKSYTETLNRRGHLSEVKLG